MGFALLPREGQTESMGEKVTSLWHSETRPCPCGSVGAFQTTVSDFGGWDYGVSVFPSDHTVDRLVE